MALLLLLLLLWHWPQIIKQDECVELRGEADLRGWCGAAGKSGARATGGFVNPTSWRALRSSTDGGPASPLRHRQPTPPNRRLTTHQGVACLREPADVDVR
jgi:hypothetical protein